MRKNSFDTDARNNFFSRNINQNASNVFSPATALDQENSKSPTPLSTVEELSENYYKIELLSKKINKIEKPSLKDESKKNNSMQFTMDETQDTFSYHTEVAYVSGVYDYNYIEPVNTFASFENPMASPYLPYGPSAIASQRDLAPFLRSPIVEIKKELSPEQKKLRTMLVQAIQNTNLDEFAFMVFLKLRDYQKNALAAIPNYFLNEEMSGYFRVPTGGGKTVIMMVLAHLLRQKTLIIVPTLLLVDQTIKFAKEVFPSRRHIFRFDGQDKPALKDLAECEFCICVTTYQTMSSYAKKDTNSINSKANDNNEIKELLKTFPLVLADEYHHTMDDRDESSTKEENAWIALVKEFSNLVIGFTATPKLSTRKNKFSEQLIYEISINSLIEAEYLCPLITTSIKVPLNRPTPITERTNDGKKHLQHLQIGQLHSILGDFLLHAKMPCGKNLISLDEQISTNSILIFCNTIQFATTLRHHINQLCQREIAADITNETHKKSREQIIGRFLEGKIAILIGCKAFVEGFNLPRINAIINVNPTASAILATQRLGRALRIADKKEYAWIVEIKYTKGKPMESILVDALMDNRSIVGPDPFIEKVRRFPALENETRQLTPDLAYEIEYPEHLIKKEIYLDPFYFPNEYPSEAEFPNRTAFLTLSRSSSFFKAMEQPEEGTIATSMMSYPNAG